MTFATLTPSKSFSCFQFVLFCLGRNVRTTKPRILGVRKHESSLVVSGDLRDEGGGRRFAWRAQGTERRGGDAASCSPSAQPAAGAAPDRAAPRGRLATLVTVSTAHSPGFFMHSTLLKFYISLH